MYVTYELYNFYTELSGCSRVTLKPLFWDEKLKYKLYNSHICSTSNSLNSTIETLHMYISI